MTMRPSTSRLATSTRPRVDGPDRGRRRRVERATATRPDDTSSRGSGTPACGNSRRRRREPSPRWRQALRNTRARRSRPRTAKSGTPKADTLDVVTRVRNRCRRHEHTRHRAQQPQFGVEPATVQVVFDGLAPGVALVGGARVDMGKDPSDDLSVVGDQGLPRRAHVCQYHAMGVTCQRLRDTEARVRDLIGDRPLSARSVLASALLGADQPRLTVGALVAMASLFGISEGAARTCLWRMVSDGELTSDGGTYALAGRLVERRERVDDAARIDDAAAADGTALGNWRSFRSSVGRRPIASTFGRPPSRCTSQSFGKVYGCVRTTLIRNDFQLPGRCWTSSAPTSTARRPRSARRRSDRSSTSMSGQRTRGLSSRRSKTRTRPDTSRTSSHSR